MRRWRTALLVACGVLVLLLATLYGSWRLLRSRSYQLFGELVTEVQTADSVVALTFDDGPIAPYSDSILDLLAAERVSATFFLIGSNAARHPELARRMVFRDRFKNHILPDQLHILNVAFLVPDLRREFGGCAAAKFRACRGAARTADSPRPLSP